MAKKPALRLKTWWQLHLEQAQKRRELLRVALEDPAASSCRRASVTMVGSGHTVPRRRRPCCWCRGRRRRRRRRLKPILYSQDGNRLDSVSTPVDGR